jgi:hypothetical protein
MVKRADVTLEWANGEYLFALKGREIEALEAECINPSTNGVGIGLGAIWARVMGGTWYRSDIRNIIRLGLMGGGMGPIEANRMCKTYVDDVPISSQMPNFQNPNCPLLVAQVILSAAVIGVEGEESSGE